MEETVVYNEKTDEFEKYWNVVFPGDEESGLDAKFYPAYKDARGNAKLRTLKDFKEFIRVETLFRQVREAAPYLQIDGASANMPLNLKVEKALDAKGNLIWKTTCEIYNLVDDNYVKKTIVFFMYPSSGYVNNLNDVKRDLGNFIDEADSLLEGIPNAVGVILNDDNLNYQGIYNNGKVGSI